MPIDRSKQIVFIHIPKTGGTSIEQMFGLTRGDCLFSRSPMNAIIHSCKTPQHLTWLELTEILPAAFLNGSYRLSFVRNPWDRFVSEFHWRRGWYFKDIEARRTYFYRDRDLLTLDGFVRTLHLPQDQRLHATRGFDGHLETQLSFIVDSTSTISLEFLGRFENFDHDVRRVASDLGIAIKSPLHLMKSRRDKDYRRYYSSYSRSAVEEFYRDDIEAFGYTF